MGIASVSPSTVETAGHGSVRVSFWYRLKQMWGDLRVGRHGSYSIERLESLDRYCKTTSRTRAALVCILTPLPALTTAVLLECIPLRSPSEGWRANWMFGMRLSLTVSIICFVGASQLITFLPNINFTLCKRLVVAFGVSAGFMLVYFVAADTVGFPVPYTWQTVGPVNIVLVPTMILLVSGRKPFARNSPSRHQLDRFFRFLTAFLALAAIFPFCKVLYDLVPARYYVCAAVLVPVVGFAAELFIIKAARELEDFIPAIIAFSVDLLTALFISVCISASPPIHISALFILVDLAQLWLEFREVSAHANTVVEFIRNHQYSKGKDSGGKLLSRMVAVTRSPKALKLASRKNVRLWACVPHPLAQDRRDQLRVLEASRIEECQKRLSRRLESQPQPQFGETAIVPVHANVKRHSSRSTQSALQRKTFIVEGLQLLFQCEYLVLVEYVECIVPLVFVIYKSILQQLPNVVYYPVVAGRWGTTAVGNTLTFAALEAASLLLLHCFLQRKFAFHHSTNLHSFSRRRCTRFNQVYFSKLWFYYSLSSRIWVLILLSASSGYVATSTRDASICIVLVITQTPTLKRRRCRRLRTAPRDVAGASCVVKLKDAFDAKVDMLQSLHVDGKALGADRNRAHRLQFAFQSHGNLSMKT